MRSPAPAGAASEYSRRRDVAVGALDRRRRTDALLSCARLVIGVGTIAAAALAFAWTILPPAWLLLPVIVFAGLMIAQARGQMQLPEAERKLQFYERRRARMEHRATGTGPDGGGFAGPSHPYAVDLDIVGPGGLFEMLCTARTRAGEDTLARFLLTPAPLASIRMRQSAVESNT